MKVLLTGGTGYVGSAVLRRLVEDGHRVTAVVRSERSSLAVQDAGATGVIGDLYDSAWLASELSTHDAAIHTAAPKDGTRPAFDDAVVDAAISAFGGTESPFIHTGGLWTYGDGDSINEETDQKPPAISAWRVDREQRLLASAVRATVIVPSVVYGHGGGPTNFVAQGPRDDNGALRLIGSGEQHWATVHVDDLADLYVLALTHSEGGTFIAASGANPTVRELAEASAGAVVPEDPDTTRQRIGVDLANALLLDQQARAEKARARLGWAPSRASLLDLVTAGYTEKA